MAKNDEDETAGLARTSAKILSFWLSRLTPEQRKEATARFLAQVARQVGFRTARIKLSEERETLIGCIIQCLEDRNKASTAQIVRRMKHIGFVRETSIRTTLHIAVAQGRIHQSWTGLYMLDPQADFRYEELLWRVDQFLRGRGNVAFSTVDIAEQLKLPHRAVQKITESTHFQRRKSGKLVKVLLAPNVHVPPNPYLEDESCNSNWP